METIFYSWQSDCSNKTNRNFIKSALEAAIAKVGRDLDLEDSLRIDQDTADIPGTPEIANTILAKIEMTYIFLADLTVIAKTAENKQVPNPNVLLELGYAMKALGTEKIITVMNEHYGTSKEGLPFDLAHRRWPIRYNLSEGTSPEVKFEIKKKLISELETAIKAIVTSFGTSVKEEFIGVPPQWKSSSYLPDNERLAKKHMPYGEADESSFILWSNGPQAFLRLIPAEPLPEKSALELEKALGALPPLGRVSSVWFARNKYGAVSFNARNVDRQEDATMISQAFKHGEIWGIDRNCVKDEIKRKYIPIGYVIEIFNHGLNNYINFYHKYFAGKPPIKIVAGLSGVEDYAVTISSHSTSGHSVDDEIIYETILHKLDVDPHEILKPFYKSIYEACGVESPEM
jgi:hypothetical protein